MFHFYLLKFIELAIWGFSIFSIILFHKYCWNYCDKKKFMFSFHSVILCSRHPFENKKMCDSCFLFKALHSFNFNSINRYIPFVKINFLIALELIMENIYRIWSASIIWNCWVTVNHKIVLIRKLTYTGFLPTKMNESLIRIVWKKLLLKTFVGMSDYL